jgi:phage terminase large subunit-like protein
VPRRKRKPADDKVTAADVIEFIETVCFIPEGKLVGRKLELFDWQKDLIRLIYDNPHGTRRAIVSMGRKNAKTTLAACLLLAHLCGPPARSKLNSQLFSAAQSRDQAGIIFSLAAKMVRINPALAQDRDNPGDREVPDLHRARHALSCAERGRDDGLRALSPAGYPR